MPSRVSNRICDDNWLVVFEDLAEVGLSLQLYQRWDRLFVLQAALGYHVDEITGD